ncbi:VOC family protein [Enterovibrio sp. ZSDZ42]|uniref:VOC family protein n=1 Tax=Enterovibrio gelatinilyticus TaxID=2899819 RepID=A0ABT5R1R2_9GAMM|nr:VOC family protein [Enterovibrio sp. ZSDZ42]MDD1794211.1 VOC family protein [Enterovibrio sp. ZSDZ42]
MMGNGLSILDVEHVGIRTRSKEASIAFYQSLGFSKVVMLPEHNACEMENAAGVRVNLIFSGSEQYPDAHNVLLDAEIKYAGITHIAFVINSMSAFLQFCETQGIRITEGPLKIGERRVACFIRDPDGTVLEFNELE